MADRVERIENAGAKYVTRAEFEREIERVQQDADYLFNEWHEKFSTLHARLTKRAKRDTVPLMQNGDSQRENGQRELPASPLPSALPFRRHGSV
jgi:hypothetical protein